MPPILARAGVGPPSAASAGVGFLGALFEFEGAESVTHLRLGGRADCRVGFAGLVESARQDTEFNVGFLRDRGPTEPPEGCHGDDQRAHGVRLSVSVIAMRLDR